MPSHHRLLCTGLVLAAAAAVGAPQPAAAYEPFTSANCTALTFTSAPRVIVHTGELPTGPDWFGPNLDMLAAVNDINDELNAVGATTAEITSTTTSTAPFIQGQWFNDPVPTIHVGFHNDPNGQKGSGGPGVSTNCEYDEAHIGFKRADLGTGWNFGVPEDGGQTYYDATQDDESGARYFRLSYLHELLHTLGLKHSDTSYSMVNYGDRPWSDANTIRPLPDDVKGLRELYPQPNVATADVAVHNSWWTLTGASNGAAQQERLCAPSLGDGLDPDSFAPLCGTGGPDAGVTQVCSGEWLRTRFTVANYSTEAVDLTARLWLSLDDRWDPSDRVGPGRLTTGRSAAQAAPYGISWELPLLGFPEGDYHPIVRVRGTTASGQPVESWTPLRGTVHYELSQCLTRSEAELPVAASPHGATRR
jgi:hypothetical protein